VCAHGHIRAKHKGILYYNRSSNSRILHSRCACLQYPVFAVIVPRRAVPQRLIRSTAIDFHICLAKLLWSQTPPVEMCVMLQLDQCVEPASRTIGTTKGSQTITRIAALWIARLLCAFVAKNSGCDMFEKYAESGQ
jgi:hypothetical protein